MSAEPLLSHTHVLQQSLLQQPAYVLYPPANGFSPGFKEAGWRNALSTSNEQLIPRSLTLGMQAPCDLLADAGNSYRDALLACLRLHAERIADDREVVAMILHRGLAEQLTPQALGQVIDAVPQTLRVVARPQVEVRVDAGSRRHPADLRGIGCTRLPVIDLAGEDGPGLLAQGQGAGFIACYYQLRVPAADDAGFLDRVQRILAMAPERVLLPAPYTRPDNPALGNWVRAWELVRQAGYVPIGGDHHQRGDRAPPKHAPDDYRHCDLARVPRRDRTDFIGIGTGACSQIGDVLCRLDDNVPRWQAKLASGHIGVVAGLIQSSQEALASEVVQQIACNHTLDIDEFEWRNAVAFSACFADSIARLQPFLARGWARWEGRILRLEPEGILLWRMMAACFRPVTTASAGLP